MSGTVQAQRCLDAEPRFVAIESFKASRSEYRQAVVLLRHWPEGPLDSQAEEHAKTLRMDSIVAGLKESLGTDLERVLLSRMSQPAATRDPRMAQSAAGAYLLAQLSKERLRELLQSSTSNSQRVILFDALASVEGPDHQISDARMNVVCQVAAQSLRIPGNQDWTWDVLRRFLFVLGEEARNGSEQAQALLADSVVQAAATILNRNSSPPCERHTFVLPVNINFEHKKLYAGDIGPSTGGMRTTMF